MRFDPCTHSLPEYIQCQRARQYIEYSAKARSWYGYSARAHKNTVPKRIASQIQCQSAQEYSAKAHWVHEYSAKAPHWPATVPNHPTWIQCQTTFLASKYSANSHFLLPKTVATITFLRKMLCTCGFVCYGKVVVNIVANWPQQSCLNIWSKR